MLIIMDSQSVNVWLDVMSYLTLQDSLALRTVSKSSKTRTDKCFAVLSQSLQRQVDELNASPLFTEYQSILSFRQAQQQARQAALAAISPISLREMMAFAKPPSGVDSICCLAAFIVLRKKAKLCTWEEFKKAFPNDFLQKLGSVEDEYLCIPSVKKVIGEYFADPNNSLARLRMMSSGAAGLFTVIETMNHYQHADYERAHSKIQTNLRVYCRIESLQTNPLPPRSAAKAQGKVPGKAKVSSAKQPLKKK
jgi:hypothetical protein